MSTSAKAIRIFLAQPKTQAGGLIRGNPPSSGDGSNHRSAWRSGLLLLAALLAAAISAAAWGAQIEEESARSPVLTKKTMGGTRRAFSGKVEMLDLKRKVLTVGTVEGGATEIFPLKKGIQVSGAKGKKLRLEELSPGTNIIVYYDYRDGRRTINEIMVLAVSPSKDQEKKKSLPPS